MPANVERTIASLTRKFVRARYEEDAESANAWIKTLFRPGMVVASGNSLTLRQLGVFDFLADSARHELSFVNQFEEGISPEENLARRKRGALADLYLLSANALTEDGKICCLDGKGNRAGALLFGPDKVLVVVGANKIVADEAAAWERIRNYVAPRTAVLLKRNLPCAVDGRCHDCNSPMRFCHDFVTVDGQLERDRERISVLIVGRELGI